MGFGTKLIIGVSELECPLQKMFHMGKAELCELSHWPQGLTLGCHLGCACQDVVNMHVGWAEAAG